MSESHDNGVKLAVLENEIKNIGLQIGRLNSHMESEQRTRTDVNKLLFSKLDDIAERYIPAKDFEELKKKYSFSKKSSGARPAPWPLLSSILGLLGK